MLSTLPPAICSRRPSTPPAAVAETLAERAEQTPAIMLFIRTSPSYRLPESDGVTASAPAVPRVRYDGTFYITWILKCFITGILLSGLAYWLVQIAGAQYLATLTSATLLSFLLVYIVWCLTVKRRHITQPTDSVGSSEPSILPTTSGCRLPSPMLNPALKHYGVPPRECSPPPSYDEVLRQMGVAAAAAASHYDVEAPPEPVTPPTHILASLLVQAPSETPHNAHLPITVVQRPTEVEAPPTSPASRSFESNTSLEETQTQRGLTPTLSSFQTLKSQMSASAPSLDFQYPPTPTPVSALTVASTSMNTTQASLGTPEQTCSVLSTKASTLVTQFEAASLTLHTSVGAPAQTSAETNNNTCPDTDNQQSTDTSTEATTETATQSSTDIVNNESSDMPTQEATEMSTQESLETVTQSSTDIVNNESADIIIQARLEPVTQSPADIVNNESADITTQARVETVTQSSTDIVNNESADITTQASLETATLSSSDIVNNESIDMTTLPPLETTTQTSTDIVNNKSADITTQGATETTIQVSAETDIEECAGISTTQEVTKVSIQASSETATQKSADTNT